MCDVVNQLKLRRRGRRSGEHARRRQHCRRFCLLVPTMMWGIPTVIGRRNVIGSLSDSVGVKASTFSSRDRIVDKQKLTNIHSMIALHDVHIWYKSIFYRRIKLTIMNDLSCQRFTYLMLLPFQSHAPSNS